MGGYREPFRPQSRGEVMAAKFKIRKDDAGKFRFHLKAPNGEIIAASRGYETARFVRRAVGQPDDSTARRRASG